MLHKGLKSVNHRHSFTTLIEITAQWCPELEIGHLFLDGENKANSVNILREYLSPAIPNKTLEISLQFFSVASAINEKSTITCLLLRMFDRLRSYQVCSGSSLLRLVKLSWCRGRSHARSRASDRLRPVDTIHKQVFLPQPTI